MRVFLVAALLSLALLPACKEETPKQPAMPKPSEAAAPSATPTTASGPSPYKDTLATWEGKWNGPEGTSLEIVPKGEVYDIIITNLDGPKTYFGARALKGNLIVFTRDGKNESIRAGNGHDTDMKWLGGKKNCLVVKPGEGYCRD